MVGSESVQPPTAPVLSVALVGRSGNGKSATGNSILGAKLFMSKSISKTTTSVTTKSELKTRVFQDGPKLHVIDTPGFIDSSPQSDFITKEVAKCIHMAEGGLQAILLVFSLRNRFTDEEKAVIQSLKTLFGESVCRFMILVFTSGDDLEENGQTLDQYLATSVGSESLQEILELCNNRKVVFDNRTRDEKKKSEQVEHLLAMVNKVMNLNGGRSFSDDVFEELQRRKELYDFNEKVFILEAELSKQKMCRVMMESEKKSIQEKLLNEKIKNLEQQLGKEMDARLKAERLYFKEKAAREKAEDNAKKAEDNAKKSCVGCRFCTRRKDAWEGKFDMNLKC